MLSAYSNEKKKRKAIGDKNAYELTPNWSIQRKLMYIDYAKPQPLLTSTGIQIHAKLLQLIHISSPPLRIIE